MEVVKKVRNIPGYKDYQEVYPNAELPITLTQEHIDSGICGDMRNCVFAKALKSHPFFSAGVVQDVAISPMLIKIYLNTKICQVFSPPKGFYKACRLFDEGDRTVFRPGNITFYPIRKNNIPEKKKIERAEYDKERRKRDENKAGSYQPHRHVILTENE